MKIGANSIQTHPKSQTPNILWLHPWIEFWQPEIDASSHLTFWMPWHVPAPNTQFIHPPLFMHPLCIYIHTQYINIHNLFIAICLRNASPDLRCSYRSSFSSAFSAHPSPTPERELRPPLGRCRPGFPPLVSSSPAGIFRWSTGCLVLPHRGLGSTGEVCGVDGSRPCLQTDRWGWDSSGADRTT